MSRHLPKIDADCLARTVCQVMTPILRGLLAIVLLVSGNSRLHGNENDLSPRAIAGKQVEGAEILPPAPGIFQRITILGASVSAGFTLAEPFGGQKTDS